MKHQIADLKNQLARQAEVLNAVSPLSTLNRGYAIVSHADGQIITNSEQAKVGDTINAQLHEGQLVCQVLDTESANDR
jgi:exodeoxyribonuclease VII large subunit